MGCASGSSSGSSMQQNSGSEDDPQPQQPLVDQKKRKRMLSNRESARRSRMRKQKHLDELVAQVGQLRKENNEILATMNNTNQLFLKVDAENVVLKAQMAELRQRLHALDQIIDSSTAAAAAAAAAVATFQPDTAAGFFMDPWIMPFGAHQPMMASPGVFMN